ncbi:hypothetical protein P167DRAFT_535222 [Morchella conica CCBAS932]|uniref:Uncharacterized protein n=1 Tax=Morchella conica CCBAS932 TaxID=1392247 RepID=A0A3N4KUK1_9PEZI|nr:hypothetical protein P167DRAFT_535222 [Morchella conica CCBAS932]
MLMMVYRYPRLFLLSLGLGRGYCLATGLWRFVDTALPRLDSQVAAAPPRFLLCLLALVLVCCVCRVVGSVLLCSVLLCSVTLTLGVASKQAQASEVK